MPNLLFPPTAFAYNEGSQDLFTIDNFIAPSENTRGVTRYGSVGNQANLTYNTFLVNQDFFDIDFDPATGIFTLTSHEYAPQSAVYLVTAQATFNGNTPVRIKVMNLTDNVQVGPSVPADGTTLQVSVTFVDDPEKDFVIVAYTEDGSLFTYPAQINNAQINLQQLSGYSNLA